MRYLMIEDPDHLHYRLHESQGAGPYDICVFDLATLPSDWIKVEPGLVPAALLAQLVEHGYDQVPTPSATAAIGWRLVSGQALKALHEDGVEFVDGDGHLPDDNHKIVGCWVPVIDLLELLSTTQATILFQQWPEPDTDGMCGCIYGLLTTADLNRRPLRKCLFNIFLDLETELAALVRRCYVGSTSWIENVSESSQVRILGNWDLARRRGLEIEPLESAMLPDLLGILRHSDELRGRLGYGSKSSVAESLNKLVPTRNAIMHPVKSLVLSQASVVALASSVEAALGLIGRIRNSESGNP